MERFFNTFREHVAVYYISPPSLSPIDFAFDTLFELLNKD